jgi:hypothetical protein
MKAISVIVAINTVIWSCLVALGYDLAARVEAQHVFGFPNSGQLAFYRYFPIAVVVLVITVWLIASAGRFRAAASAVQGSLS